MPTIKPKFYQSLYWKLTLWFVGLVSLVGVLQLYLATEGFRNLTLRIEQQIYWDSASALANEIQPMLHPEFDQEALENRLFEISILNPTVEAFILNIDGEVIFGLPIEPTLFQKKIDVGPLKRALQPVLPELPLFGSHPLFDEPVIFSVTPLIFEGREGYLYLILDGRITHTLIRTTGQFFLTETMILGIIITTILSIILGALIFRYLTRQFYELTRVVALYENGAFHERVAVESNDEIANLALTINSMASKIEKNTQEITARDSQRRELIAAISHDLRGPLTSVRGYVEMLLEAGPNQSNENIIADLRIVQKNVLLQARLISDLFELSKLEATQKPPDMDCIDLKLIAKDTLDRLMPEARKSNIRLEVKTPPTTLPLVLADTTLISRALQNLTENALRYTKPGGSIQIELQEKENTVQVQVHDSGIGIPAEVQGRVGEAYYQVSSPEQSPSGGLGLGLAIVKKIVALHGGELSLHSKVNEGTTFSFELPTEP